MCTRRRLQKIAGAGQDMVGAARTKTGFSIQLAGAEEWPLSEKVFSHRVSGMSQCFGYLHSVEKSCARACLAQKAACLFSLRT